MRSHKFYESPKRPFVLTTLVAIAFSAIGPVPQAIGNDAPSLVKDINLGNPGADIASLVQLNGVVYFTSQNGVWKSDGSSSGTNLLRQFEALEFRSGGLALGVAGNLVYISASDGTTGLELWKYDPSTNQTSLVKDIWSGPNDSQPSGFVAAGNDVYFTADDGSSGRELWKSNGTEIGTVRVADLTAGPVGALENTSQLPLFAFDSNTLFFEANDATRGREPHMLDNGSASILTNINVATTGSIGSSPTNFFRFGTELIFSAALSSSGNRELVVYDTTMPADTEYDPARQNPNPKVFDINAGSSNGNPGYFVEFNNKVYFQATGSNGTELYSYSGGVVSQVTVPNADPTIHASDTNLWGSSGGPELLTVVGQNLFFRAASSGSMATGRELWKFDGTNFFLVKDIRAGSTDTDPSRLTAVGQLLFFEANDGIAGTELWVSDGTANGTTLVKDIYPGVGQSISGEFLAVGSNLFFTARDAVSGYELWKSDGTAAGTIMVRDVVTEPSFSAFSPTTAPLMVAVGDKVIFRASDSVHGEELWISDGTSGGTSLVKDINPGPTGASITQMVALGSVVYFRANDGTNGSELWRSDGTAAGTSLVKNIRPGSSDSSLSNLRVLGNKLIFTANNGTNGTELWVSDGTEAGTSLLKDIYVGSNSSDTGNLVASENLVYFRATDGLTGIEIWRTDGTSSGTVLLKDIGPGPDDGSISNLGLVGRKLIFRADDGTNGSELWISDGTSTGTVLLKDINPGGDSSLPTGYMQIGSVGFFQANSGTTGPELWKTDGTSEGTALVKDIAPGISSSNPQMRGALGTNLIFVASDGTTGSELWISDATENGTRLLKDIAPGADPSSPLGFVAVTSNLAYFFADDGSTGYELWKTDGTTGGTQLASEIRPGSTGSLTGPRQSEQSGDTISSPILVQSSNAIYFVANEGIAGLELWKINYVPSTGGSSGGSVAPSRPYEGPLNLKTIGDTFCTNGQVTLTGERLNTVEGVQVGSASVAFELLPNGNLRYSLSGIPVGQQQVRLWIPISSVYLTSQISVGQCNQAISTTALGKVNVGSFNGKLVVYAAGLEGKRISWKVGGRWGRAVANSSFARFDRPTPRKGVEVNVEVFVDGVSQLTKRVVTR